MLLDEDLDELARSVGDHSRMPPEALAVARELVWRKCVEDKWFFLRNFWHVETVGKGYALMDVRDYQADELMVMIEAEKRERIRAIRLKARQIGYTTIASGAAFHSAFFHPYHSWLMASQGQLEAQKTLTSKIKNPYYKLPQWMRERGPNRTDDSQEKFTLDNGSVITSVTSTGASGRGDAVFGVILDELAFVEGGDDLLAALDPLCYGPLYVFSTANGIGNAFHTTWLESRKSDSEWNALSRELRPDIKWNGTFHPWSAVPKRDEKWYEREKRKYRGREHLFYQEYPSTPEEAFIKSGRTVLPIDIMEAEQCWCEPEWRIDLTLVPIDRMEMRIPEGAIIPEGEEPRPHELYVWELPSVERDPSTNRPLRQPNYVISTDTSEGLEDGDASAITVIDANTMEEVASYVGHWEIESLGPLLEWLGYFYHTALQAPERNNMGLVPIVHLQQARYPRIWKMDQKGQRSPGKRSVRFGWATTQLTKPRMVYGMVKALKDGVVRFHDRRFLEEAYSFIADSNGAFGASHGNHDDAIMSRLIGVEVMTDLGSYPVTWVDPEPTAVTFGMLAEVQRRNRAERDRAGQPTPIGQSPQREGGVTHGFIMHSSG